MPVVDQEYEEGVQVAWWKFSLGIRVQREKAARDKAMRSSLWRSAPQGKATRRAGTSGDVLNTALGHFGPHPPPHTPPTRARSSPRP